MKMNLAIRSEIHSILSEALESYFQEHEDEDNYDDCECQRVVKAMNWILAGKG
tara:strand:+ start:191 stop:349 length:159 start_codon:yes stop_codon:yes gene_type:complete